MVVWLESTIWAGNISRKGAKAQRKHSETWQRFAPLREKSAVLFVRENPFPDFYIYPSKPKGPLSQRSHTSKTRDLYEDN
jgi:hypothetical protein